MPSQIPTANQAITIVDPAQPSRDATAMQNHMPVALLQWSRPAIRQANKVCGLSRA
jgi:hypothetical protein